MADEILKTLKDHIAAGKPIDAELGLTFTLSGLIELGEKMEDVKDAAMTRECPAVVQAVKDIKDLEDRSNRNDTIVGIMTGIGTVIGFIFGKK